MTGPPLRDDDAVSSPRPAHAPSRRADDARDRAILGRVSVVVAAVLLVVALLLDASSNLVLIVVDGNLVEPALAVGAIGAGAVLFGLVAWSQLRGSGPLRSAERGVIAGLVAAPIWVLVFSLMGVFGESFTVGLSDVAPSLAGLAVGVMTIALVAVVGRVVAVRRRRLHRLPVFRPASGTAAILVFVTLVVLAGDVARANGETFATGRGSGGCAVVAREVEAIFSGKVMVYRAVPGSPFALLVDTYWLDDGYSLRDGDVAFSFGDDGARAELVDGFTPVDVAVPGCT